MKNKKVLTGVLAVLMTVVALTTSIPVYAYVSDTAEVPRHGTLTGWQDDLEEIDYAQECWVGLHTTLSGWSAEMRTVVEYELVNRVTGDALTETKTVENRHPACDTNCYLSSYGYYENQGDIVLYSAHWVSGVEPDESVGVYLKDIY